MKSSEFITESRSDKDLLQFHQDELTKLGPDGYKTHKNYHESWIKKLQKRIAKSDKNMTSRGFTPDN